MLLLHLIHVIDHLHWQALPAHILDDVLELKRMLELLHSRHGNHVTLLAVHVVLWHVTDTGLKAEKTPGNHLALLLLMEHGVTGVALRELLEVVVGNKARVLLSIG